MCLCVYVSAARAPQHLAQAVSNATYVYVCIYIYKYLLIYPVALRAISATVPTAFFVIRSGRLKEIEPKQR